MPSKTQPQAVEGRKKWVMPPELEPFRDLINNTGGNTIEELMNDHDCTVVTNAPRALLCVAVNSQISLLKVLYERRFMHPGFTMQPRTASPVSEL